MDACRRRACQRSRAAGGPQPPVVCARARKADRALANCHIVRRHLQGIEATNRHSVLGARMSSSGAVSRRRAIRQSKRLRTAAKVRRRAAWIFFAASAVLASVLGYIALQRPSLPRIDASDLAQVELGSQIYASNCASCHGARLEGQANWQARMANDRLPAPPHDASGHTWHHGDEMLFRTTKYGPRAYPAGYQTDMPGFEGRLTDEEIAAALAFIKSTWPAEIRTKQARMGSAPQSSQK